TEQFEIYAKTASIRKERDF
ncbi:unnamed protein product, partial [Allacma fusca]